MPRLVLGTLLLLAAAVTGLWFALRPAPAPPMARFNVAQALGGDANPKFARAETPRPFRFPQDHGPHPEFRNEWWYFTGNLSGADGRRYGYELSLFRIALSAEAQPRRSDWATNQAYMGHFAVTDANGKTFHFFERFARGAAGLAGARAEPFAVWLEDWRVAADSQHPGTWRITTRADNVAIDLRVTPAKPIVLQGDRGLSRKNAEPGNASYYYSIPRLATEGTITIDGKAARVRGSSWLDREWSTSALGPDQVGWDWFALQLDDGHELMFYQLRHRDGGADPFSAGVWIDAAGGTRRLAAQDVTIEVLDKWNSPRGGTYPSRWRLTVPSAQLSLEARPVLADQELDVSVRYWEGAVDVSGTRAGRNVAGVGYVELTGYAGASLERTQRMAR
jgi:predicted secreted hydrolase